MIFVKNGSYTDRPKINDYDLNFCKFENLLLESDRGFLSESSNLHLNQYWNFRYRTSLNYDNGENGELPLK